MLSDDEKARLRASIGESAMLQMECFDDDFIEHLRAAFIGLEGCVDHLRDGGMDEVERRAVLGGVLAVWMADHC